jgi:hypothetical protein
MKMKRNENKAKWGITAVNYDEEHKYITKVKISLMRGDTLAKISEIWPRQKLITALRQLDDVVTVIESDQGTRTVNVHISDFYKGEKFIRSVPNSELSDDLGKLPYFKEY